MATPITHPDLARVRSRCAELRQRIQRVLEEWHHRTTVEHPQILARYEQHFGALERERQNLALQCAELFRRVELLTVKASRGEVITAETVELINSVVDKEYARMHQRYREAFGTESSAKPSAEHPASRDELVQMYRTLAKRLHPDATDLHGDGSLQTWHRVQEAYRNRDAARLRTLLTVTGAAPDDHGDDRWSLERWQQEERTLEARLRMEQRKVDRMQVEEPFVYARDLDRPAWVERHRMELEADLQKRRAELVEHRRQYRELAGGTNPPGRNPDSPASQAAQNFDQDFMENTYFGGR